MAVIAVSISDVASNAKRWAMPETYQALRSPVPQGILVYEGTQAIALKIAGNFTSIALTLTMPLGFSYLMRNVACTFASDDLTNQYNATGLGLYTGANFLGEAPHFNIVSPGEFINNTASRASRLFNPTPLTPKLLLVGNGTVILAIQDMHADESPAGDFFWYAEFYIFNVDQVDKWEVNAPIPTISHTSF